MITLLKVFFAKLKRLFTSNKGKLGSTEQVHWVNHIHDEFCPPPSPAVAWANLHGFDEGPGTTYWVGLDCRNFGIRSADYVIKCKTKAMYDKYIGIAKRDGSSAFLQAALHDSGLNVRRGNDVEIKFIFKWADEDKSFNVRLSGDLYAEEK